ncbi:MAG: dihydrofolate reductase, partial [Bacilli bacterium]|nr:dihydrofolate reductase [Bacilli bacterium]
IIGGASIYRQTLPYADLVYLTKVNEDGGAEVFFENLDENPNFELAEQSEPILDNGHEIRFCTYRNKSKVAI